MECARLLARQIRTTGLKSSSPRKLNEKEGGGDWKNLIMGIVRIVCGDVCNHTPVHHCHSARGGRGGGYQINIRTESVETLVFRGSGRSFFLQVSSCRAAWRFTGEEGETKEAAALHHVSD